MKKQIFTIILLLIGGVASFGQFKLDGGTQSLRLQTGGVDRLFVTPAFYGVAPGNIGINTINPTAKLTVAGDVALQKIQRETVSGGYNDYDRQDASIVIFENGGTIGGIQGGSKGQMLYVLCGYGNNQSSLTIRHDAASNPTASNRILTHTGADFVISSGAGGVLLIYDDTKTRWRIVETPSGSGTAGWGLTGNAGTNPATQFIGTTDAQPLAFKTNNGERMRILSGGNVGIGTTTPDSKLHLANTSTGQTASANTILTLENSGDVNLSFLSGNTTSSKGGILFGSASGNTKGQINYTPSLNKMDFATNDLSRISIDGTGNVGIGTTTPDTKLDVYGDFALSKYSTISAGTYNALDRLGASSLYINSSVTINGIAGGKEGTLLYLVCGASSNVTINHASGSALISDQILTNTDAPVTITGRGGAIFIYQVGNGWRLISYAQ